MIGSEFLEYVSKYQIATYVGVEDFADKFNFIVTVVVLLLCATVVTVKQYMMKPISCYMATDIGGKNLLDYVENYCWVQGTIPIAYAGRVPESDAGWEELEKHKLLYYQWVPFVLGLQCILFYVPRVIWQMICYNRAGTDIQHLVLSASEAVHATDEQRLKMVQHVARTLEQLLFHHQQLRAISRYRCIRVHHHRGGLRSIVTSHPSFGAEKQHFKTDWTKKPTAMESQDESDLEQTAEPSGSLLQLCCTRICRVFCFFHLNQYRGTYLSLGYILVKLLYLANAIGQLFVMQYFLGFATRQWMFGAVILRDILVGHDWRATLVFPRVAYCYAPVKHLGTAINTVTAQCVLPVNMLNEKIYIFLWWWILFVAFITALSLLRWSCCMLGRTRGARFIEKYLSLIRLEKPMDALLMKRFSRSFLGRDGVFLLRILSSNVGDLITSEIVATMWSRFVESNSLEEKVEKARANGHCVRGIETQVASAPPPAAEYHKETPHNSWTQTHVPRGEQFHSYGGQAEPASDRRTNLPKDTELNKGSIV